MSGGGHSRNVRFRGVVSGWSKGGGPGAQQLSTPCPLHSRRAARETQRVSEAHKALREAEALPDAEMYFGEDGIATARAALTAPAQS